MMKLVPPNNQKKILLHSCCAPCSCSIVEKMVASEIDLTVFYYNPNIYPRDEYEIRKNENKRFADSKGVPFVDADYDPDAWMDKTNRFALEKERGKRCDVCFDIRFEKTANFANNNNFKVFTSSLGISRWKDLNQVTDAAVRAAKKYSELTYWDYNWRKDSGSEKMYTISKEEKFYKQEYCGCIYSLESANNYRKSKGKETIARNKHY